MRSFGKPKKLMRGGKPTKHYFVRIYDRVTRKDTWVSTSCVSRAAALEWARTKELEEALGPRKQPVVETPLRFEDGFRRWLSSKEESVTAKHLAEQEQRGVRFWLPFFSKFSIDEITSTHLRDYLRLRSQGRVPGAITGRKISATTLNNDLVALKSFFAYLVSEELLVKSPASPIKRFVGEIRRRVRTINEDEEARLLAACRQGETLSVQAKRNIGGRAGGASTATPVTFCQAAPVPDYLHPLVFTALYCGFRRRTLLSLCWKHLDFAAKTWRIPGELMKAGVDYSAPVPANVLAVLTDYRKRLATKSDATTRLKPDASIFGLSPGSSFQTSFRRALRRAGIAGFTFHDCRRVYLNRLRQLGVSLETAMALTGHKSIETVLKHYREVPASDLEDAVSRLGRLSSPRTAPETALQ